MKSIIITTLITILGFAVSAFAAIINVPLDYPTIQTGINASTDGDTVLVQPGIYVENINFNGHNIVLGSLFLTTGDTSYISQTIIDGDSSESVVTFESGEDNSAAIYGFTIQNGNNIEYASGINCHNYSSPTISNNYIRRNYGFRGAGIDCRNSSPIIHKNIIAENNGYWGSGVYCYHSYPTISENTISDNYSHDYGIVFSNYGFPVLNNNTITRNFIADDNDGAAYFYYGSVAVNNNVISENSGSGIHCQYTDSTVINNNVISGNSRGITCYRSPSAVISNNTISGNSGVGIFCSSYRNSIAPTISGNIISGNSGGGITCYFESHSIIINNTIIGNTHPEGNGFGIRCEFLSIPTVVNTILWANSREGFPEISLDSLCGVSVSYCNIQDTLWPGDGNISIEPLFRDTLNHDYHLMSTACGDSLDSPCIDVGSPAIIDSLLDCTWGLGSILCDMGAYGGADSTTGNNIVINVPADYPTIQLAIDAGSDGDTILVQPDIYYENINLNGHNIIVASMYMMTGDNSYVSSTIIDGSNSASVVTVESGEDGTARIIGFTIQNGWNYHGAGIYCQESNPVIANNIIKENDANGFGAGILCLESSSIIKNNLVTGNIANQGGAICCMESNPIIINNTLTENMADISGGGIYCTLVSNPVIINTILWGDIAAYEPEIDFDDSSSPYISYSNIQGGWDGEGNLDTDPLFRDPENGDFHLMSIECGDPYDSPCIDAGHPDILDSLLDCSWGLGTILSDMGAYGGGDSVTVGIKDYINNLPDRFALLQNYPNPFNPATTIRYTLPEQSKVRIEIYNILGQLVATLFDGHKQAGYHTVTWQADHYPSGIYFTRLEAGHRSESIKIVLLK